MARHVQTLIERMRQRPGAQVPLAWRNLTADKHRLVRSAAGVGFAVLLMFMQMGFRNAFIDSTTEILRMIDGDLFIVSATKFRVGWLDPFPRRRLSQALGFAGVKSTDAIYIEEDRAIWKNVADKTTHPLQLVAFDPDRAVFLSPEINAKRALLKLPNTVMMDRQARRFIGPRDEGLRSELARRRIRIVGTFPRGPDFTTDGMLLMGDRNFLKFFAAPGDPSPRLTQVELGVIKLAPSADTADVQHALSRHLPHDVQILTKDEILALQADFHAKVSSVGPIFALGTIIGFVVGVLISYQIMYNDLTDQWPQYATLKAMGYSNQYLRFVVMQQATFFALIGFCPAFALSVVLYAIVSDIALLPMHMSLGLILVILALTLAMCLISGAIAVRRVMSADPAEVF